MAAEMSTAAEMASSNDDLASRLRIFYELHNPEKLVNVDRLVEMYRNREHELWSAMSERYGAEAVRSSAVANLCRRYASSEGEGVVFHQQQEQTIARRHVVMHGEVLAEILITLIIGDCLDEEMRQRETLFSTSSHTAVCAHRILIRLSSKAKLHLKKNGGLRVVVEQCGPEYVAWTEPGITNATSRSIFVLIDRALTQWACAELKEMPLYALVNSQNDSAHCASSMSTAIIQTEAWRAIMAKSKMTVEDEIQWLRDTTYRAQSFSIHATEIAAHIEHRIIQNPIHVRCSLSQQLEFTAQLGAALIDLCETLTAMANTSQNQEEIDSVGRLIRLTRRLVGLSATCRNRLFTGQLAKIAMPPPYSQENNNNDDDDIVEIIQPPNTPIPQVVDLTAEDELTEDHLPQALCRDADFEEDESDGEHDINNNEKGAHFKDSRGRRRRSGRPSDVDALLARAATRGRGQAHWRASQASILAKRMDRAIWDAFRSAEFEPLLSLLDHGASANYSRLSKETALMAAAYCGRDDVAKRLLELGADPEATDSQGNTAVTLARVQGHNQLAEYIHGLIVHRYEQNKNNKYSLNGEEERQFEEQVATTVPHEIEIDRRASKRRRGDDSFIEDDNHHEEEIIMSQPALASSTASDLPINASSATALQGKRIQRSADDDDLINKLLLRKRDF
uniref:Uncharacterized protein n=1 Tax=Aureoumbra lagunensis TaxID=44058 RepID=A0A7S3NJJ4_9STRA